MARILQSIKDSIQKFWLILIRVWKAFASEMTLSVRNPLRFFTHMAYWLLTLYLTFAVIGAYLIYKQKSEWVGIKAVSVVYPFPIASVDKSVIWITDYYRYLDFLEKYEATASQNKSGDFPKIDDLPKRVVDNLIEDKIVYVEAQKAGIKVTDDELNQVLAKQGNEQEVQDKIKKLYGMTVAEYKNRLAIQIMKEKLKDQVLHNIQISHIFTVDELSIKQAQRDLTSGIDFATVAQKYSQDTATAKNGGDLGYWRRGELAASIAPEFETAAFALQLNQISAPVKTKFGFHIIKLTAAKEGVDQSYDDWYASTKKNYKIRIFLPLD